MKLYQDNVLVLMDHHDKREERTAGGIVIPQAYRGPKSRAEAVYATIIAAGPGWYPGKRCPSCGVPGLTESTVFVGNDLKPGDRVIVEDKDIGDRYEVDGVEHRIIRQHQVLGVVER